MSLGEGEALLSPELFDAAYENSIRLLSDELRRPKDEQLLPEFRKEMEEVFTGLYMAKHFAEDTDDAAKADLIQRGLQLKEPERRWTHTQSFAKFVGWFQLQG